MRQFFCAHCGRIVDSKGHEVLTDLDPDPESIDLCNSCNDDPETVIAYLLKIISNNRHHIPIGDAEQLIKVKYEN